MGYACWDQRVSVCNTVARKAYPLRLDPKIHAAVEKWAADDLRSVNAQIEFLLRQALKQSKRTS
jgi:hypothetical protein